MHSPLPAAKPMQGFFSISPPLIEGSKSTIHRQLPVPAARMRGFLPVSPPLIPQMQLSLESAHTFLQADYLIDVISSNIVRHSDKLTIDGRSVIQATKSVIASLKSRGKPMKEPHILERYISKGQCTNEDKDIITQCLQLGYRLDYVRHSVPLTVEPSLTIVALKSMLQPYPWIPRENLLLVKQHDYAPLDQDNATLGQYHLKDSDTLLACMGGSFTLIVHETTWDEDIAIPVASCFETLGQVREKIHRVTRFPPKEQILHHGMTGLDNKRDETPLVALGIVRPYLSEVSVNLTLWLPNRLVPSTHFY